MSSLPAVIAALKTVGEATLSSDEWQVVDGPIETVTTAGQRILLIGDDEIESDVEFNSLAASDQDDRYGVPLLISVGLPGAESLAAARTEALDAYEAIRDAILAPALARNLGLAAQGVLEAVVTGERRVQQFAHPEGRACQVRFVVRIWAQLNG